MIITYDELSDIRHGLKNKKIVLALGAFDLFHFEHLRYLLDAKKQGDVLVVAVKNDEFVKPKGSDRPIVNENQRALIVDNIKGVDYTFIANKPSDKSKWGYMVENDLQQEWFSQFYDVFEALRPDVLYFEIKPELKSAREKLSKIFGFKLVSMERTAIVSTTKIINKIRGETKYGNN